MPARENAEPSTAQQSTDHSDEEHLALGMWAPGLDGHLDIWSSGQRLAFVSKRAHGQWSTGHSEVVMKRRPPWSWSWSWSWSWALVPARGSSSSSSSSSTCRARQGSRSQPWQPDGPCSRTPSGAQLQSTSWALSFSLDSRQQGMRRQPHRLSSQ